MCRRGHRCGYYGASSASSTRRSCSRPTASEPISMYFLLRVHLAALGAADAERRDARRERGVGVGGSGDQLVGQRQFLPHAPHRREQRQPPIEPPCRAAAEHLDLERRAAAPPTAGAGRARSASAPASSSARCSITSSACAAMALMAVPPSMLPTLVLLSRRGGRLSARAMRQISSIALGRPRLAQEWPPGPRTTMRARRLPTASTATCSRP